MPDFDLGLVVGKDGKDAEINIDDSLSTRSENAVQNKVITSAINGKANTSHTHQKSDITDFPVIPDMSNVITKSSTAGLIKNDGSIDTTQYLSSLPSHTHTKSEITDFQHTHSISDVTNLQNKLLTKLDTSNIANNLTTTASGKILDARQGKILKDLIGDAIDYINL
jgi:hypothetical protein